MDGAPASAKSLWPSVIQWKPWDETGISWLGLNGPTGVFLVGNFFFFFFFFLSLFLIMFFFFPCSHFFLGPFFFSLFSFS